MNLYYLGTAINTASLYMTAGVGALLCVRCGEFNLGGEGQIYTGGFVCALILNALVRVPAPVAVTIAFLCSAIISGSIVLLSALMKKLKNADFLFTTFIISAAIVPFIDGLISGPCRTTEGTLLSTPNIAMKFRFPSILSPSPLSGYFFAGVILCVLLGLFLYRSTLGRRICIYGISTEFARYSGYSDWQLLFFSAFGSGALHGICGAAAVCGAYYTCYIGFCSGMGWNSLSSALIGMLNPFFLIPSSIFMSFITTYANKYALLHNFGFDISALFQAVILFLISFVNKKGLK